MGIILSRRRRHDDGGSFVTRAECSAISTDIKADLKIVKSAVVGEDLRGGMVKDIGDLKLKVDAIASTNTSDKAERKQNDREKRDTSLKYKIALLSLLSAVIGAVITHFL
jgi:hypothetical protein